MFAPDETRKSLWKRSDKHALYKRSLEADKLNHWYIYAFVGEDDIVRLGGTMSIEKRFKNVFFGENEEIIAMKPTTDLWGDIERIVDYLWHGSQTIRAFWKGDKLNNNGVLDSMNRNNVLEMLENPELVLPAKFEPVSKKPCRELASG